MRSLLILGVLVTYLACAHAAAPATSGPILAFNCPDPTGCTQTNGTGVYYVEGGFAGIGEQDKLMITHFMPGGSGVQFQARYFETTTGLWRFLVEPGSVAFADYADQTGLPVLSFTEEDTAMVWTLQGANQQPIVVTGGGIRHLRLYLRFTVGLGNREYVIDFNGSERPRPAVGTRAPAHYVMRWGDNARRQEPTRPYCRDAQREADSVVFQRGLDIAPIDGTVVRNARTAAFVTMSCFLGAPATAYQWNYDYRASAASFYFDAAIQMKRASYCADAAHYTVAGTPIELEDDRRINVPASTSSEPEAWWSPDGAICVNLDRLRRPDQGFTGVCGNRQLPSCDPAPTGRPYLINWSMR